MRWNLERRDVVSFAAIVVIAEVVFVVGDRGPAAYALGLLFPVAMLLGINAIVGATRRANPEDADDDRNR